VEKESAKGDPREERGELTEDGKTFGLGHFLLQMTKLVDAPMQEGRVSDV
jgi:hypothetical protein